MFDEKLTLRGHGPLTSALQVSPGFTFLFFVLVSFFLHLSARSLVPDTLAGGRGHGVGLFGRLAGHTSLGGLQDRFLRREPTRPQSTHLRVFFFFSLFHRYLSTFLRNFTSTATTTSTSNSCISAFRRRCSIHTSASRHRIPQNLVSRTRRSHAAAAAVADPVSAAATQHERHVHLVHVQVRRLRLPRCTARHLQVRSQGCCYLFPSD